MSGSNMSNEYLGSMAALIREGKIPSATWIKELCDQMQILCYEEPNVIYMDGPVTICGDIHGNLDNLLKILSKCGTPSIKNRYLFLGDYVDRGKCGIEVVLMLFIYKVMYKDAFILLRGNHESLTESFAYDFARECVEKTFPGLLYEFNGVFNVLPLAAIVNSFLFCVHGGISPEISSANEIDLLDRYGYLPGSGPITDLLWSDPCNDIECNWKPNPRGCGWMFSNKALEEFLLKSNLKMLCRSHNVVEEGYEIRGKLVAIWSSSTVINGKKIKSAVLQINEGATEITDGSFTLI